MLDEMFQQNASKLTMYLEYENPRSSWSGYVGDIPFRNKKFVLNLML